MPESQIAQIQSINIDLFTGAQKRNAIEADLVAEFQYVIWSYYHNFGRQFAWRHASDPYHIVVSEIMLQQTQTYRVEGKFEQFIDTFPSFESLASAPTRDVIAAWQGLGYNRRGLALHAIAQRVVQEFNGALPCDPQVLETFSGIGKNTAGSIAAFAFNRPTVFIETNIRSVFIHFFFQKELDIHDSMILPLVEKTLDGKNAREWYYALMDYGVALKKLYPNPNRNSIHYAKQSKFDGSDRQIRGAILRLLLTQQTMPIDAVIEHFGQESERIKKIVEIMVKDGFLCSNKGSIRLR